MGGVQEEGWVIFLSFIKKKMFFFLVILFLGLCFFFFFFFFEFCFGKEIEKDVNKEELDEGKNKFSKKKNC